MYSKHRLPPGIACGLFSPGGSGESLRCAELLRGIGDLELREFREFREFRELASGDPAVGAVGAVGAIGAIGAIGGNWDIGDIGDTELEFNELTELV